MAILYISEHELEKLLINSYNIVTGLECRFLFNLHYETN